LDNTLRRVGRSRTARDLMAALALAALASAATADIWECVDESGNKRFTNIRAEAKGCKLLNVGPPNTVPGVQPRQKSAPAPKPAAAAPAGFPKVDADTQRERDGDRRRILERELANEEKLLLEARKDLAEQEAIRLGSERNYQRVLDRLEPYRRRVRLHEDNVANLRRELGGLR
jgi:hypothetical protein